MISILSKNDTAKNIFLYFIDAIKAMRCQIASFARPILDTVQVKVKRPYSYIAMKNLMSLPNTQRVMKWSHVEALKKIWVLFCEIPSLVDGSFVGCFTRQNNKLNNDLNTYIGVMTNIEQLVDKELGQKIDSLQSIKFLPFPVEEKEPKYMSPGLPVNRADFPHCAVCRHRFINHPPSNEIAQ
jgi:hypothetical protein